MICGIHLAWALQGDDKKTAELCTWEVVDFANLITSITLHCGLLVAGLLHLEQLLSSGAFTL